MKGQTLEMLGFLALSITIIVVILFMRRYLATGYGESFSRLVERQEIEGQRAGAVSILQTTDETTKKSILELLGILAFQTLDPDDPGELNFGPGVGSVNVLDELEWRMNSIYGEGKWYVKIPYPYIIPRYQMIILIDSSASLCDDFADIKDNLDDIIGYLRDEKELNVAATIFMLPGGQKCCSQHGVSNLKCEGLFSTSQYLHCVDLDENMCSNAPDINGPQNNEDWGRGLACAIERGPYEGWYEFTAKIGIILSDELPMGSDDGITYGKDSTDESLNTGIKYATGSNSKSLKIQIFPFKAETGKGCCAGCGCNSDCVKDNCPKNCRICVVDKNDNELYYFTSICCEHDQELDDYMKTVADQTNGEFYELSRSYRASETIGKIFDEHKFKVNPYIDLGTPPISNENLNSVVVPVSVPHIGGYTNIYISTWS